MCISERRCRRSQEHSWQSRQNRSPHVAQSLNFSSSHGFWQLEQRVTDTVEGGIAGTSVRLTVALVKVTFSPWLGPLRRVTAWVGPI